MKNLIWSFLFLNFFLNCSSSEIREIDMDNVLEEELRAEPDIFKDSKNLKNNEKENPLKQNLKR